MVNLDKEEWLRYLKEGNRNLGTMLSDLGKEKVEEKNPSKHDKDSYFMCLDLREEYKG
jgi:hypothetical protein